MQEMRNLIDMRFGPGTWQKIIDERQKRIVEAKEAQRLARIQKRKEDEEFWEMIKMTANYWWMCYRLVAEHLFLLWYTAV
jgi:hypothetical protein